MNKTSIIVILSILLLGMIILVITGTTSKIFPVNNQVAEELRKARKLLRDQDVHHQYVQKLYNDTIREKNKTIDSLRNSLANQQLIDSVVIAKMRAQVANATKKSEEEVVQFLKKRFEEAGVDTGNVIMQLRFGEGISLVIDIVELENQQSIIENARGQIETMKKIDIEQQEIIGNLQERIKADDKYNSKLIEQRDEYLSLYEACSNKNAILTSDVEKHRKGKIKAIVVASLEGLVILGTAVAIIVNNVQ